MPDLPVALTDTQMGMPMTAGGIPFMCYKVQRIARLAQPAPEGGQPLLLSLPPGPPAGGLSLNDTPETGASPATYGVWPSCSPAVAQLLLDIYGHATKQPAFTGRGRQGHNFLWWNICHLLLLRGRLWKESGSSLGELRPGDVNRVRTVAETKSANGKSRHVEDFKICQDSPRIEPL